MSKKLPIPEPFEPDSFDAFWRAYPRKVVKQPARVEWNRLRPSQALQEAILADIRARCTSQDWVKEGGTFIPYPSTYLHQRRWEDEGVVIPEGVVPIAEDKSLCTACAKPVVAGYPWCEEHRAYAEKAGVPLASQPGRAWNRRGD